MRYRACDRRLDRRRDERMIVFGKRLHVVRCEVSRAPPIGVVRFDDSARSAFRLTARCTLQVGLCILSRCVRSAFPAMIALRRQRRRKNYRRTGTKPCRFWRGGTRAKNPGPFDTPALPVRGTPRSGKERIVKKIHSGTLMAITLCALLSACASTGTRVTSNSDVYKSMARSQQGWCSQFGSTCGCTVDGQPATCALAATCLNTGSCQPASQ